DDPVGAVHEHEAHRDQRRQRPRDQPEEQHRRLRGIDDLHDDEEPEQRRPGPQREASFAAVHPHVRSRIATPAGEGFPIPAPNCLIAAKCRVSPQLVRGSRAMNLREFFDRYGVPLGVIAALALVIALLPGNAERTDRVGTVGTSGGRAGAASGRAAGATADTAGTGATTVGAGTAGEAVTSGGGGAAAGSGDVVFGQGPNCRPDGRQIGISTYMPPCVEWLSHDNGGATADGVTGNQILVIRWLGQIDDATKAILQAYKLADDDATVQRAYDALRAYSNHHYETYGREVVFKDFHASAVSTNDEAMIADAAQIADMHPFAVIEGNPAAAMPTTLARELSARGVLCLCTTSLSSEFYQENTFVISTGLPTGTEYCQFAAEYVGKRLAGKPASRAGDELNPLQQFKTKTRVFGLIYLNGAQGKVDPEGERIRAACESAFAQYGVTFAKQIGYLYDPGRNQNDVTNMIA